MLHNDPFYYSAVRKTVAAFGALLNGISIQRKDASGTAVQTLEVPVMYLPKSRFFYMTEASKLDGNEARINTVFPRMGYEMTSLFYDNSRKLQMQTTVPGRLVSSGARQNEYAPVPYSLSFSVYLAAKNTQDALQVIEQIIPFFQPTFNLSIWEMDQAAQSRDVPVTLQNVDFQDSWDGQTNSERTIIWTMTFVANIWVHGPSKEAMEIKIAQINTAVSGTSAGSQTTATVNPPTASSEDSFTINISKVDNSVSIVGP